MTFEEYKPLFEIEASNAGYSEQNLQRCLNYAEKLLDHNLPVIYNTSHLASLVGYKKEYLKRAAVYTNYYYRDFFITKKNGKLREISEPLPSLKDIQIWILKNILSNIEVNNFAKAYRKKVGLRDNLKFHKDQPKVLTLDIRDFFTSIKIESVQQIFRTLGYSAYLSNLMAKLCCKNNSLPQGAPTSPYLSNIFFKTTDESISNYCIKNKIKYTRYADDLTFSGDFNTKELLDFVSLELDTIGLVLNNKKTRLMKPGTRQIVTGIVVNKKPQVPYKQRNALRANMHYLKTFNLENCIEKQGITQANYLEHLLGKVSFVVQINPEDKEFVGYKEYLISLKNKKSD